MNSAILTLLLFITSFESHLIPEKQAHDLTAISKETSVLLTCLPGNGTDRILIGKRGSPVDAVPTNGEQYSGNLNFGMGDELEDGNFVLALGAETSFTITGLTRDTRYFFTVYEFNSNGYRYLTTLKTNTTSTRTSFIYAEDFINDQNFTNFGTSGGGGAGSSVIQNKGRVFYDFTKLTGDNDSPIQNGNPGLVDYGPRKIPAATVVNTPKVKEVSMGQNVIKTLSSSEMNAINTNNNGSSLIASSFEINMLVWLEDGISSDVQSPWYSLCGLQTKGNVFELRTLQNGQISVVYSSGSGEVVETITSPSPILNGTNNLFKLRVRFDFEKDSLSVWRDNFPVPVTSSNIAALNPEAWTNNNSFFVGNRDNGIMPFKNLKESRIAKFVITDLLTSQEAADLDSYLRTIIGGEGDYNIGGAQGFTTLEQRGGDIYAEGDPGGWQSYIEHKRVLPTDMEEFEFETKVQLSAAPDGGSYGFSIGIRNDLSTEPNRAVLGFFSTETDNPSTFSRAFIYYGNGTLNPNAFAYASQSNTISPSPSLNVEYKIIFRREIQGADARYTITVIDTLNDNSISSAWTEVNKPSSQYFGSSMRTWFHQNGGTHTIKYWIVRRLGDDPSPPITETFDVYVSAGGNDSNNGASSSSPKRTIEAGLAAIASMGGSGRKLGIAAGNYVISSFQNIPLNCSLIQGAGIGVTNITGASNLYTAFTQNPAKFLFQAASNSRVDGSHTVKDLTLHGESRKIVGGIYIRNRDNITLDHVEMRSFNFSGSWIADSKNGVVKDCQWFEAGGQAADASYQTGNICISNLQDYDISGGRIEAPTLATGYALKVLHVTSSGPVPLTNLSIHDMYVDIHPESQYIGKTPPPFRRIYPRGSGNTIDNINFEFHSPYSGSKYMYLNNVKIYNNTIINGFLSFGESGNNSNNGTIEIYNNNINTIASTIECHAQKLKVYNNFVKCQSFMFTYNPYSAYPVSYYDWHVHNNVIEVMETSFVQGAMLNSENHTLINCVVEDNTLIYTTTAGPQFPFVKMGSVNGVSTGFTMRDNAISGQPPASSNFYLIMGSGLSGKSQNNIATHINTLQTVSGLSSSGNSTNKSSLGFKASGTKPTPYYQPNSGSPLIGSGYNGSNVGAY